MLGHYKLESLLKLHLLVILLHLYLAFTKLRMILEGEEMAFPLHSVKTTVIHDRDTTSSISPLPLRNQYDETVQDCCLGGGGGYSTNIYTGRLRPESNPVTPLYTIFPEKRTPFVYLLLTNGTLLHTLFKTLHPFNCGKCDVFHNRNQSQK